MICCRLKVLQVLFLFFLPFTLAIVYFRGNLVQYLFLNLEYELECTIVGMEDVMYLWQIQSVLNDCKYTMLYEGNGVAK